MRRTSWEGGYEGAAGAAGINQSRCVSTWISDFPTLCDGGRYLRYDGWLGKYIGYVEVGTCL